MNVSQTSSSSGATVQHLGQSTMSLNADAFLQMFTTQIANQNPLDPMDTADFLNQFAQMTSVQTLGELQKTLDTLNMSMKSLAGQGQINEAAGWLGKTVQYVDSNGALQQGTVESIRIDASGPPQLVVSGNKVDLSSVRQVF